jgi:glyoxylase-like metal-dependent hydrolase (beta-lactamase superfamily II)
MRIGDIEIQPVMDGSTWDEADKVYHIPGVEDCWACRHGLVDERRRIHFAIGGFLVRTKERVALVDTGVGTINNGQYAGGRFLESLGELGVSPDQVTDVLFSHLHFDHVGWATKKGTVTFPNATYRAHRRDWEFFMEGPNVAEGAQRKLNPLKPRLELFDADVPLIPGIDARLAPGHTPGSTVFIVSSGGARAILLGDAVHSPFELEEREWEALVDVDPQGATLVRNALADEVADTDDIVSCPHFPGLQFGRVVTTAGQRKFYFV